MAVEDRPLFQRLWSRPQWRDLPVYRSLLTPLSFLERTAHVFPEKLGVVDGDRRVSYGEFAARVYRLASALSRRGVSPGDRVAVLCRNALEVLEAHFAVPQIGAILVPINVRLQRDEVRYILDHSRAKALLLDAALAPVLEPVRAQLPDLQLVVWIDVDGRHGSATAPPAVADEEYEAFIGTGSPEPSVYPLRDEEETLSINYTSGTTGRPKGVMVTHRGAYLNALGEVIESRMTQDSAYLWTLPMFHCNGWYFPYAVTAVGATHVVLPKVDPSRIFPLIERERVTHLCGAPTVLTMLLNGRPHPEYRFPHPVTVLTAAAPPTPAVIRRMEEMGGHIIHVYGLTETYGPHTVCEWHRDWDALPLEERARLKARQGVGYIHAPELRVVDEEMRDVPADGQTLGEVVMRGNNVMKGYYRDPEATREAFRGGWFHSGDLAVVHPDGYIELRDRKKDLIISGGENISTIEVERVLCEHPEVVECAVIGIPDDTWGEVPKAFVVLREGARVTADQLIGFCRERLAHFKCPKVVEFVSALPKTSTGKTQKNVLREREWAGQEKRIH